jgi:hypothetical protein
MMGSQDDSATSVQPDIQPEVFYDSIAKQGYHDAERSQMQCKLFDLPRVLALCCLH